MGKPVWVLLPTMPEWRWMLERENSPWYPTMHLFRQQKPGEWSDVLEQVGEALDGCIAGGALNPERAIQHYEPQ